jgi:mono/diheme cytochrome c family protein
MAVKNHMPWTAFYLTVAGGLAAFATYTIVDYEIFPPGLGLQGRQLFFTDMMDSTMVKAYEAEMRTLPEGVVSRNMYVQNYDRTTAEGQALTSPYGADVETGEQMFKTYCAPCHAADGMGAGPVSDMKAGSRFPIPGVPIAGAAGVGKMRSDGYIYLTIRNGSAIMPAHDWAMSDPEMWSVVDYIRTLDGAQYVPPAPPAEQEG